MILNKKVVPNNQSVSPARPEPWQSTNSNGPIQHEDASTAAIRLPAAVARLFESCGGVVASFTTVFLLSKPYIYPLP